MSASFLIVAALLLRNPFWPIGYEGVREEISAEMRVAAKAAPEPKDGAQTAKAQQENLQPQKDKEKKATVQDWVAARKTLRIGGTVFAREPDGSTRSSVFINGRDYVDNDFVSVNFDGYRFTWRVTGLTESGTLKLERVRAKPLEKSRPKGTKK
ncbi:MAG: hypothetical protein IKF72_14080 [Kiritimatiellae bacterium]|nr:hypothetical protein [Kiritimatiellia bacterium]